MTRYEGDLDYGDDPHRDWAPEDEWPRHSPEFGQFCDYLPPQPEHDPMGVIGRVWWAGKPRDKTRKGHI